MAGHVRPLEPRPIDARWLTMILDWFPPPPFARLPDPSVGGGKGFVEFTLSAQAGTDLETSLVEQPDGKILVAGSAPVLYDTGDPF